MSTAQNKRDIITLINHDKLVCVGTHFVKGGCNFPRVMLTFISSEVKPYMAAFSFDHMGTIETASALLSPP